MDAGIEAASQKHSSVCTSEKFKVEADFASEVRSYTVEIYWFEYTGLIGLHDTFDLYDIPTYKISF